MLTQVALQLPGDTACNSENFSRLRAMQASSSVSATALPIPAFNKLTGKRVVLASASPRRAQLLAAVGLTPEIVPSTFEENLPKSEFRDDAAYEYPVETAASKGIEVYHRLSQDVNPPDFVIAADTIVLKDGEILEKPIDKNDALRMLQDLNDGKCEVVTGVALVHPILTAPGYVVRRLTEKATVHFGHSSLELLTAYAESGEGLDRAGAFAIQGLGGLFVRAIEGDWNTVVGFPIYSFFAFLHELAEDGELDV
ncbi:Maf-domain-containing protein [Tilletiaria anomala UBC 951]|uniref:Maf-domain-containing protein n=1 Tax=Tilletiaria anomala (strain ATCC 24038 / CBS 436.72 / UBC 951) TaxID=1037660 RepID=A0A066VT84_TILAU|nr:Maf-domain-containing protein [Tilletiaria anomala UBC 951]KDN44912.1 Maf-domain-containing protein [Tilletiaria anomala UBC 951]